MTADRDERFADLLRFARASVRRLVRLGGVHRQDADDLLAEAAIALLRAADVYDPGRSAWVGYAASKARNAVFDAARTGTWTPCNRASRPGSAGRVPTFDPQTPADGDDRPGMLWASAVTVDPEITDDPEAEFAATARAALACLSDFERAVMVGVCVGVRPRHAVAAAFGLTAGRVSQATATAVERMRERWPTRSALAAALYD